MKAFFQKLLFAVIILSIIPIQTINCQWITGHIDTLTHDHTLNHINTSKSIAIDELNTIYAVWQKRRNNLQGYTIFFSKKIANGIWSTPIPVSDTVKNCSYPSIVVAKRTHNIFIVYTEYVENINSEIILATESEKGNWNKMNLSNSSWDDGFAMPEVDSLGNIHVAWKELSSKDSKIKYCSNVSGSWKTSILNDNFFGDNYYALPSLTVTQIGTAHIMYNSLFQNGYRNIHAQNNSPGGDQWQFEELPEEVNGAGIIQLDKIGVLHFIYNFAGGFQYPVKVFYTRKNKRGFWINPECVNNEFNGSCSSVDIDKEGKIYLSLDSLEYGFFTGKIYYATNKRGAWEFSRVSDTSASISNLKIDNSGIGHIISNVGNGGHESQIVEYESANNLINISSQEIEVIDFALSQNYPNPFNPSTTITFKISKRQFIRLTIYDITGKKIDNLLERVINPGSYKLTFNGTNLTSGIYFYRMQTEKFSITKTMIFLK